MSSDEGCGVTIGLQGFGDLLLFSRSFTGSRGQGGCSIHECSHNTHECVRRILTPLDIQVAFRPHYTIRNTLVHPKDKTPTEQRSGIVYKISCSECPKVYIGQTGRSLKQRITEHRRAIRNGDLATSALAEHAWNTGHHFDTATAEIIDAHPHVTTRCLLESWHIQKDDNTINREKGTLPREYTSLLG